MEFSMSGWKARIGYLSPSVFETPSDWDLILPKGFTIVSSGLNVQSHTEAEFDKAIEALGVGLGIFAAEECDVVLMGVSHWEPSVVTPPSNRWLPNYRGKLVCR
jgi:hypothetical protein